MSESQRRKHFQMLRSYTLADLFTLSNAACGTASLFVCLEYMAEGKNSSIMWWAFGLLFFSLIFDVLDGFIARRGRRPSVLGADLDSLADIVSFGVAPAVIGYALGLRQGWDIAILIYFVVCGISRLARFNVTADELAAETGKVKYYEGTPIPTSLLIMLVFFIAFALGHTGNNLWWGRVQLPIWGWHPLSLLFAVSGSAMISSSLRIPKP